MASDATTTAEQDLLTGSDHILSLDIESSAYRLQPLLSDWLTLQLISPFSFLHSLANPEVETKPLSNINDTTQQS